MSNYCAKCGTALPDRAGFCPSCGAATAPAAMTAFGEAVPRTDYRTTPSYAGYAPSYAPAAEPLSPFAAMILPLKRYADFSGRSTRMEYWMFTLLWWVVMTAGFVLFGIGSDQAERAGNADDPLANSMAVAGFAILMLWWLGTLIPAIAVFVRRLHDQDKPGALVILFIFLSLFLSIIGWFIQTIFMCLEGTPGPNQYGPDPKGRGITDIFA